MSRFLRPSSLKLGLAILALAGALSGSPSEAAVAKPEPNQISAYEGLNEGGRVRILIMLAKTGRADQAEFLLQHYPLEGPLAANRKLFIEGLICSSRRDLPAAAAKYRQALANDPHLTLVRSELAQTLAAMDENESAKHHLELLKADAPDLVQAQGVQSFIDRIDEKRPYTVAGYVSLAPSTNFNGGSSHTTVYSPVLGWGDIPQTSQKTSGVGVSGGVSLGFSKRLNDYFQMVTAANVDGRAYADSQYDLVSFSESAEMRRIISGGYLSAGLVSSQLVAPASLKLSYYSYGPRLAFAKDLSQRNRLVASTVYEFRDYGQGSYQNGWASTNTATISHAVDSSFSLNATAGYDHVAQGFDFTSYHTYSLGVGAYKELSHGITVQLDAMAKYSNFEGINPVALVAREDQRYIGSITLTKRDWDLMGFAPTLNYTYTRNASNIALYDYDSHSVELRLTKDF
ncbi:MAG: porin family protein [Aestuariivirga sp.]